MLTIDPTACNRPALAQCVHQVRHLENLLEMMNCSEGSMKLQVGTVGIVGTVGTVGTVDGDMQLPYPHSFYLPARRPPTPRRSRQDGQHQGRRRAFTTSRSSVLLWRQ